MIVTVLLLGVLVTAAVLLVRRFATDGAPKAADPHAVRRFFQYLLLYGLLVISALGLSGLLARLFAPQALATAGDAFLARSIAFTVVGLPILALVGTWSGRRQRVDAGERNSFAVAAYLTLATVTALLFAMNAAASLLQWAFGVIAFPAGDLADLLVWGAAWTAHTRMGPRLVEPQRRRPVALIGSVIGLIAGTLGLGAVIAGLVRFLVGLDRPVLVPGHADPALQGTATLVVGAAVWAFYWVSSQRHADRSAGWLGYVLLAGMSGGLATALIASSAAAYDVGVWFLGSPGTTDASRYFHPLPGAGAAALVGVLVWWYHRDVFNEDPAAARTEVQRVRDYLLGGIALGAAAAGLLLLVVAAVEAIGGSRVVAGDTAMNSLISSFTLLVAGTPVWWIFWRGAQRAAAADPVGEHDSPSRRVYLYLLLGVSTVAAVAGLLAGTFLVVEDILGSGLSSSTLFRIRFPVAIVITAGAVAAYHWTVLVTERRALPARPPGPAFILLVGPADPAIARAVAQETGASVRTWIRADSAGTPWTVGAVSAALEDCVANDVLVISGADGLSVIPVLRD